MRSLPWARKCRWPPRLRGQRAGALSLLLCVVLTESGESQTFVQLSDMGQNVGPRLTRTIARARIGRALFGRIGSKVSFINNGVVYQFASDPDWGRITIGNWNQWIHEFNNGSGLGGRLTDVQGIDISARRNVYAADRSRSRLVVATFDPSVGNLISPRNMWGVTRPGDVAWDGRTSPLTQDFVYVVDDSLNTVSYWDFNAGTPTTPVWSYGTRGSGTGQFLGPSSVCVGKTPSSNGGTQFTSYFYVVDRGNKRVVWLDRQAGGPSLAGMVALSGWDPTDCAVDHFGHLYVVDQKNHRIHKFNYVLWLIDSYGTPGRGPNNLNTLWYPRSISVPCGLKVVNSITVWYCEGRVLTAEQWGDSTGAVEHYLGINAAYTSAPNAIPNTGWASITYKATDVAYTWADVHQVNVGTINTLATNQLRSAGQHTIYWDGTKADGTRAPSAYYRFRVWMLSAYGCPGNAPWCYPILYSSDFYFDNCTPSSGGGDDGGIPLRREPTSAALAQVPAPDPCTSGASVAGPTGADAEPTTLYLQQRVVLAAQPLTRVTGPQTAVVPPMERIETQSGGLTELVRQHGVRGLRFSVTREAATAPAMVRVHALSGRLVRVLVSEQLQPGVYEVGWDGLDDRGRRAAPGVYIAVMTAGSFRATQRLILRQP